MMNICNRPPQTNPLFFESLVEVGQGALGGILVRIVFKLVPWEALWHV